MTMSAPRSRTNGVFALPAVVATVAPRCLASWIAMDPTPPAPPWISTFWPGCSRPRSTSACHAVSATSGSDAAASMSTEAGAIARSASFTAMRSANVPIRSSSGRP